MCVCVCVCVFDEIASECAKNHWVTHQEACVQYTDKDAAKRERNAPSAAQQEISKFLAVAKQCKAQGDVDGEAGAHLKLGDAFDTGKSLIFY